MRTCVGERSAGEACLSAGVASAVNSVVLCVAGVLGCCLRNNVLTCIHTKYIYVWMKEVQAMRMRRRFLSACILWCCCPVVSCFPGVLCGWVLCAGGVVEAVSVDPLVVLCTFFLSFFPSFLSSAGGGRHHRLRGVPQRLDRGRIKNMQEAPGMSSNAQGSCPVRYRFHGTRSPWMALEDLRRPFS